MYTRETELAHYGVKGMKWGVRRKQNKLNRMAAKADKYQHVSDVKKICGKNIFETCKRARTDCVWQSV